MLCFQDCVYREYMFWENKNIPQEEAFNGILTFCFNIFGEVNAIRKNNCRKKKMFQTKFGISTNEGEKMFILNTVVFFCVSYLISFFFFFKFGFLSGKKNVWSTWSPKATRNSKEKTCTKLLLWSLCVASFLLWKSDKMLRNGPNLVTSGEAAKCNWNEPTYLKHLAQGGGHFISTDRRTVNLSLTSAHCADDLQTAENASTDGPLGPFTD